MKGEIKYNLNEKLVIYGLSVLFGLVMILGALLLASIVLLAADLPEIFVSPLSAICAGAGAFSAGFLSSKKIRSGGLLNGVVCGMAVYALIFIISLIFSPAGFSAISFIHFAIVIILALLGGVLGVVSQVKRKLI